LYQGEISIAITRCFIYRNNVRYWIYWNDLIQGPFELDELVSLHAFSEDLLVCMEGREDWLPAARVADLAPSVELLRSRRTLPAIAPPPPTRPPSVTPLQGELFGDSPAQQPLFGAGEGPPKGTYSYAPVSSDAVAGGPPWFAVTMPFHFGRSSSAAVLPEKTAASPSCAAEDGPRAATIEMPPVQSRRLIPPRIQTSSPAPLEQPAPEESAPADGKSISLKIFSGDDIAAIETAPELESPPAIHFEEFDRAEPPVARLLPWLMGASLFLFFLGAGGYWIIDHYSSHSAIVAAAGRQRVQTPLPKPVFPSQERTKPSDQKTARAPAERENIFAYAARAGGKSVRVKSYGFTADLGSGAVAARDLKTRRAFFKDAAGAPHPAAGRSSTELPSPAQAPAASVPPAWAARSPGAEAASSFTRALAAPFRWAVDGGDSFTTANEVPARPGVSRETDAPRDTQRPGSSPSEPSAMSGSDQPFGKSATEKQMIPGSRTPDSPRTSAATAASQPIAAEDSHFWAQNPSALSATRAGARHGFFSAAGLFMDGILGQTIKHLPLFSALAAGGAAGMPGSPAAAQSAAQKSAGLSSAPASKKTDARRGFKSPTQKSLLPSERSKKAGTRAASSSETASGLQRAPKRSAQRTASQISGKNPSAAVSGPAAAGKPAAPGDGPSRSAQEPAVPKAIASAPVSAAVSVPGLPFPAPPASFPAPDPWAGRQAEAIELVIKKPLYGGKTTVGKQAALMLESMHEKELLHAAETGERLYLPDKIAWAALKQEGSMYRVYLNFSALQANGDRAPAKSYQFTADIRQRVVDSDDAGAREDFLDRRTMFVHHHNPMADDIESILGGVDAFNRQVLRLLIARTNKGSHGGVKDIQAAIGAARSRLDRGMAYFRSVYVGPALDNVAKAYQFTRLVKSNG